MAQGCSGSTVERKMPAVPSFLIHHRKGMRRLLLLGLGTRPTAPPRMRAFNRRTHRRGPLERCVSQPSSASSQNLCVLAAGSLALLAANRQAIFWPLQNSVGAIAPSARQAVPSKGLAGHSSPQAPYDLVQPDEVTGFEQHGRGSALGGCGIRIVTRDWKGTSRLLEVRAAMPPRIWMPNVPMRLILRPAPRSGVKAPQVCRRTYSPSPTVGGTT